MEAAAVHTLVRVPFTEVVVLNGGGAGIQAPTVVQAASQHLALVDRQAPSRL